ncbi:hypothetical protein KQ302_09760 [Synechococcus sp. CS-602]|uniref:hypothetical protein n=2 Tax=Synechococcales TaxID=1890424 RepID=UPI0008FF1677|nr:hypothetical protein [Synechococcus sp. CS-603]APD48568.1 hypothetical protein BM449_10435 [Synechococcus sp. SynAce01]MCT0205379.1 hypothetical protein [Synechococcus sp. CS-602]MCT0246873.1 hypothetical protein [Synechococcus sp. CS-601]TWB95118.1 hypothetical protein FB106_102155 [Synechococcus sp. Ace-Pa]MCT0203142.1 hypothetical protein [Synechococcus sp. CS-603]
MDLALAPTTCGYRLQPASAVGMLWLQTHFEDKHWHHLAEGNVSVEQASADLICDDATAAGLCVSRTGLPTIAPD